MKLRVLLGVRALAFGFVLCFGAVASAGTVGGPAPDFSLSVSSSTGDALLIPSPSLTPNGDGSFSGTASGAPLTFSFSSNFTVNDDPFISGSFSLVNLSPSTQLFTVGATLNGVSLGGPVKFHGSFGAATFTDQSADNAVTFASPTLASPGSLPFMTARIDGSQVAIIGAFEDALTSQGGSPLVGTHPREAFGEPVLLDWPGITNTMAVSFAFSLTPGDKVEVPFEFIVVPEPSGLATFAIVSALFLCAFAQKRASKLD